jgi:hypothetical protein
MTDKTAKYRQEIQQVSKLSFLWSGLESGLRPATVNLEQAVGLLSCLESKSGAL